MQVSMKNNTIYLEAAGEKNRLKIGIYTPKDVIWHYEELPSHEEKIAGTAVSMAETLNRASRKGCSGGHEFERLKSVGRMLCDELLPLEVKEKLRKSDAEYLILKLDERLVHIPWELLCVDDRFLCQRFNMGRLVKTRQKIADGNDRHLSSPLSLWILANPRGDLEIAGSEGLKIFQNTAALNQDQNLVNPCLDAEITPDEVKEKIKSYDFVHFAGHGDYKSQTDPGGPGQSGWRLTGGNFTVNDIDRMAGGAAMPAFIFSNACQSARTEEWRTKADSSSVSLSQIRSGEEGSFGLANAFLRAGVKHYLGTFWEIMDEPGSHFADEFYSLLYAGEPVGKAVKQARCNLIEKYGPDTCWASYILYGDPRTSYFSPNMGKTEKMPEPEPAVTRTTPTRGSFFNYGLNSGRLKEVQHWIATGLATVLLVCAILAGNYIVRRISLYEQVKIQELLIAQAEKKQQKTEALFNELTKTASLPPASEKQDSGALTLAMVFDSQISLSDQKTENLAAFAVQSRLIEYSRFKIAERKSFDKILLELMWEKPEHLNLLMPDILIFLEVYNENNQASLLMRVVDKHTGILIDNLFETLENGKPVFAQKEKLSENLLKTLKKHYPLKGCVTEIADTDITLNIGDRAGVRIGQWFKAEGADTLLQAVSVEADMCIVRLKKGDMPQKGDLIIEN